MDAARAAQEKLDMAGELMTSGTPIDFLDPPRKHPAAGEPHPIGCTPSTTVRVYDRRLKRAVWVSENDYSHAEHGMVLGRRAADGTVIDDGGL